MGIIEIVLISFGLAMDAFAVAVCKGISMKKLNVLKSIIIGIWFGFFQAIMPIIGFYLGTKFESFINSFSHIIAFILLLIIGANMIKENFEKNVNISDEVGVKSMFWLSMATSIDALTLGITFALFNINIFLTAIMIGLITFILSFIGVLSGQKFGDKYERKAQIIGGLILISLGIKNLFEHFY